MKHDLSLHVEDGPAYGTYEVARCSVRMVFTVAPDGKQYVLDEDGDVVEPGERAFVYERAGGVGHMCGDDGCYRYIVYRYAGAMEPGTGEYLPASETELYAIRLEARNRILAWSHQELDRQRADEQTRPSRAEDPDAIRLGPDLDEATAKAASYLAPRELEPAAASLFDAAPSAGALTPANRMVPALPLTEEDLAALDEHELRYSRGQVLQKIGPKPNKDYPDGPPRATIVGVDEKRGRYLIAPYPGCVANVITFPAAEIFWRPVTA